jgi:hypothetical protein
MVTKHWLLSIKLNECVVLKIVIESAEQVFKAKTWKLLLSVFDNALYILDAERVSEAIRRRECWLFFVIGTVIRIKNFGRRLKAPARVARKVKGKVPWEVF